MLASRGFRRLAAEGRRRGAVLSLAVLAAALVVLGDPPAHAGEGASRIVSIGGSVTEIVFALGAEDRLVAVDTTSRYPQAAGDLPDVGYMRALSAEGVLSRAPDLVIAIEGAGPPQVIDVLREASVPFVEIPEGYDGPGLRAKILAVGAALGAEGTASDLAERVARDLDAARQEARATARENGGAPSVAFLMSMAGGRPMAAGAGTSADAMIALAGGTNVFSGFSGFKPVTREALIAADPAAIVTMRRHGSEPSEAVRRMPGVALTRAGEHDRIIAMDGLYLLGFGPRTAEAVRDLAARLRGGEDGRDD